MKPYTILHEHPDHFIIRNGKAQFKIAKSGISGETANKIKQFADGGTVDEQGNPISPRPSSDESYMSKPFDSGTAVLNAMNPVKKADGGLLAPPDWVHPHPTQDEHPLSAEQYQSDMGSVKAVDAGIGPNYLRDFNSTKKAAGGQISRDPASIKDAPNPDTYQATPLPQEQDTKDKKPKKVEVNMDASDFDNLAKGGKVGGITPANALNHYVPEKGIVGGTIRDGSDEERFHFDKFTFDIDKARDISKKQPNGSVPVSLRWLDKVRIDPEAAMNSDSKNPVFIAQVHTSAGLKPLLIDGNHRMYKAAKTGEKTIPAYIFTPQQTISLMTKKYPKSELKAAVKKDEAEGKVNTANSSQRGSEYIPKKMAEGGKVPYREPQKYNGDSSNPNDSVVQPSPTPEPFTPTVQDAVNNINSAFNSPHGNPDNKAMGGQITNPAKVHSIANESQSEAIKRYADGNPATLAKGGHVHHNAGKNQLHFHFYDGAVVPTILDKETGGGDIQQSTPLDNYVRMADGGDPADSDSAKLAQAAQDAQSNLANQNNMIQDASSDQATPSALPAPTSVDSNVVQNAAIPPEQQISAAPKPAILTPDQQPNLLSNLDQSLAQEKSGIEQGAAAQSQGYQATANAIGQNALQQKAQMDAYKIAADNLTQQNNQLFNAVATSKVDPDRFWNNKSTGSKIASVISVLLGGIGSGISGGPNLGLQTLQNHIQNDIASQQNDQSNKMNLYKMGLERFRDSQSAQQFATMQSNALLQGQLQKIAAQTGSPQAQATAQQMIGQLGVQNAGIRSELAIKQAAIGAMNGPQPQTGVDPNKMRLLVAAGVIPKEEVPAAMKEYGDYGKLESVLNHTQNVFGQLTQNANYRERLATALPFGSHLPTVASDSKQYEALANDWLGNITKDTEGRVTPTDVDLMRPSLPQIGDSPAVAQTKLNNIKDQIREKYSFPTLQSYKLVSPNDPTATSSATRKMRFTERPPK